MWRHAISENDLPIVLLLISDASKMPLVQQLVQAHAYWRLKGLAADLVILDDDDSVYRKPLHDEIIALVAAGTESPLLDKPGGIFVRRLDQIPSEDRILLQAVARIVLGEDAVSLAEQLERKAARLSLPPALRPVRPAGRESPPPRRRRDLIFQNGLGRLHPRRPGIHHHPHRQPDDARAVGERDRQFRVRHRRVGEQQLPTPGRKTATSFA